jgi:hypothetical protein
MKNSAILVVVALLLSIPAEAGPMPVGTDTMPIQGGRTRATPDWAKAHAKLATAQSLNYHQVKKLVIEATEIQPSGPPPIWHVRAGTAFPVRDKQAEHAMLNRIYAPQRHVQATIINSQSESK